MSKSVEEYLRKHGKSTQKGKGKSKSSKKHKRGWYQRQIKRAMNEISLSQDVKIYIRPQPVHRPNSPESSCPEIYRFQIVRVKPEAKMVFYQRHSNLNLLELAPASTQVEEDDEIDINIGLDFGTSSVKTVVYLQQEEKTFCVPFREGHGIESYLLPTNLYIDSTGTYSLEPKGSYIGSIKANLMDNPGEIKEQAEAAAFLALALQRIKGWIYTELRGHVDGASIFWHIRIGLPSVETDRKKTKSWKNVLRSAIVLAEKPSFSYEDAKLSVGCNKIERLEELQTDISVVPEITSELYTAVHNNGFRENGTPYVVVDIGASTIDVAACEFTRGKNESKYYTWMHDRAVFRTGACFAHAKRIKQWLDEFSRIRPFATTPQDKDLIEKLCNQANLNIDLQPETQLPDSFEEYFSGFGFKGNIDVPLFDEIGRDLGRIIGPASRNIRPSLYTQVFVMGGASSAKCYRDMVREVCKPHKMVEINNHHFTIKDLTVSPDYPVSESEIWTRLAVAYGLARGSFGATSMEGNAWIRRVIRQREEQERWLEEKGEKYLG